METATIIFILIMLLLAIITFYYLYFIRWDNNDSEDKKEIPYKILYEQEKTIVDVLEDISKKYGRYPALKRKDKDATWRTLFYSSYYQLSHDFAERLLYYVGPQPRVAILSFNRPEWFCAHMGTMIACGLSVGIYPTASPENCSYIVNHSSVDVLIVEDSKQLSKFSTIKMPTVKIILVFDHNDVLFDKSSEDDSKVSTSTTEYLRSIKDLNPKLIIIPYVNFITQAISKGTTETMIEIRKPYPEDVATIIYTSGTTGDPKGVVITHKNIISSLKVILNAIRSRSNTSLYMQETFISYLPLNHIAAQLMDIYIPLISVGTVYFAEQSAIKGSIKDTIKEVRPTVFIGVPRVWEKIHEKIIEKQEDPQNILNKLFVNNLIIKEMGLDRAKYCISAAAPISKEVREFFKNLGIELCDVYGMSETTGPISIGVPGCSNGVGVPVIDVKIDRETKEIMVKGDTIFKEYYKNDAATKEAYNRKGWLKTGDTGYVDRDGSLYVTGRIKDIIITAGGENVSPIPIEEILLSELNKNEKLFEYVVVIGDQKKFLSVLLIPTKKYSKTISDTSNDKMIQDAINETNKKATNNVCTLKKYKVLNDVVFEVGDCLTPTYKIKRQRISEKFKQIIDDIYSDSS